MRALRRGRQGSLAGAEDGDCDGGSVDGAASSEFSRQASGHHAPRRRWRGWVRSVVRMVTCSTCCSPCRLSSGAKGEGAGRKALESTLEDDSIHRPLEPQTYFEDRNGEYDGGRALRSEEWERGLAAIMRNDVEALARETNSVQFQRALIVWRNRTGETIPHLLSRIGAIELLRTVLSALPKGGVDRLLNEVRERERGLVPLHAAAASGYAGCIKVLLEFGAIAKNQFDRYGLTPLHRVATSSRSTESGLCAQLLLEAGADPLATDQAGFTPFQKACFHGNLQVVQVLCEHAEATSAWGNVIQSDKTGVMNGKTMLHIVAKFAPRNAQALVELLAGKPGISLSARCGEGLTPLLDACLFGNVEATRGLLRCGADPNARDLNGRNTMHVAVLANNKDLCSELLTDGRVNLDAPDNENVTPRSVACKQGLKGFLGPGASVPTDVCDDQVKPALRRRSLLAIF